MYWGVVLVCVRMAGALFSEGTGEGSLFTPKSHCHHRINRWRVYL